MAESTFAIDLEMRIERRRFELGYCRGWRLLYSPAAVLESARVAFIATHPGGTHQPASHAEFAMDSGSAYEIEQWLEGGKKTKLQREALALFEIVGERPEDVLAGNLVPFRSPSWEELPSKDEAVEFGSQIWAEILDRARPRLVVGVGRETWSPLKKVLAVSHAEQKTVGWGSMVGERGSAGDVTFVGLPHLSRFAIVSRQQSQDALRALLGEFYRKPVRP